MTSPMKIHRTRAAFVLRPSAHAVAVSLALLASQSAFAQSEPAQSLQRVEVTGSSIKRIEGESSLPVETIKREDIEKSGVTTAAELLQKISSNVGGLTDGASITDINGSQKGFNGANMRGLGVSSTLILLNGRRLANFATPGDNSGVDLNNIPSGAIQRVEVLKDGASAIYGTDAMGGVINFITRKDYQGLDVSGYALTTQQGGAGKRTATISGGFGDLEKDRFNVMGVFDYQKLGSLRSNQRSFIADNDVPNRLPLLTSSQTFPANFDLTSAQRTQLKNGPLAGQNWLGVSRTNLSRPTCNPTTGNVYAPGAIGGPDGCTYNYMANTEIYPESTKANFLGRATIQLSADHQFFAELLNSKTETFYAASPSTFRVRSGEGLQAPAALTALTGITGEIRFRSRLEEAGLRTSQVTSTGQRIVLGLTGNLGDWEYNTAVNHAVNKVDDVDVDGWVSDTKLRAGIASGAYNIFTLPTNGNGKAFMDGIKVTGGARYSEGVTDQIDFKATSAFAKLGGGDAMVAIGVDMRRETTNFSASDVLNANDIVGDKDRFWRAGDPLTYPAQSDSRVVQGIYAEISAPLSKELEAQFALRYDRYGKVRTADQELTTTNPKISLSYRPSNSLLVRGSAGTGFRAPTVSEMYRPVVLGTTASIIYDPVGGYADQFPMNRYAACDPTLNPALATKCDIKPEKSQQISLGAVFQPAPQWNGSIDYWMIRKSDIISDIGDETIFNDPTYYNNPKIVARNGFGEVDTVYVQKANRGKLETSGFDFTLNWRGQATDVGRFGAGFNSTLVTKYEYQTDEASPLRDGLGKFRDDKAVQKWRYRLNFDYEMGALGLTLTNTYLSGYTDQNVKEVAIAAWNNREVEAYSLWDLTGNYKFSKSLVVRAGVLNVLNTMPPFTNQTRYFQTSWDPTYADPRGRSFYVSGNYSFK